MKFEGPFSGWLKQRRKALGLTQQDLANQVGCAVITVRKIEAHDYRPSQQICERMADALMILPEERATFVTFARGLADKLALPELTTLTLFHNLPPQLTPFIGRASELAQIAAYLADAKCRLLSLVGPGGIGKTRLALQAVADKVEAFVHGIYFVSLTPVSSKGLIAAAIANALQISFYGSEEPNPQVIKYLRGKHMLLILDNYEHLLEGTDLLTDILMNAPRLKLLVTSRERLNIQEEWVLPVDGLSVPDKATEDEPGAYDAVKLFVQCALRIQPGFSLAANQDGVLDICHAVEGMPLAIELAATWLRVMTCPQIATHIRHDLDFLASPMRRAPARHRSLRTVFDHSWRLLSDVERSVLRRLSVFRGSFELESAAYVALATLPMLAGLVDKSLVRYDSVGRYEMHELLRQYAADKLAESNEIAEARQRHLQFFLDLAERMERRLFGPQHLTLMDRLETEHNNFRAAMDWAFESQQMERGLRLAGALGWFWIPRAYWNEGRYWLEKFLVTGNASVAIRAKALRHLLEILYSGSVEQTRVMTLCADTLVLVPELQDPWLIAWVFSTVGLVVYPNIDQCEAYLQEGLARFRVLGDNWGICWTLNYLAQKLFQRGEFVLAGELQDEGIRLARQSGDKSILCWLLFYTACRNWYQGHIDRLAVRIYSESLELFNELRYKYGVAMALSQLGKVERLHGNDDGARSLFEKSLLLAEQAGNMWHIVAGLVALAGLFCTHGESERGIRILGTVENLVQRMYTGPGFSPLEVRQSYERAVSTGHSELGEAAFQSIFAAGKLRTLDWAIASVLDRPQFGTMKQSWLSL